ncbi:MarR family transcriptional regulator [Streptomyces sp. NPDC048491]|uniref:MarR family winged helix-turn-helix transcriptional regulator n=1 Tax=unclassified Streptomyces TaxID=2593676 RepID=UPI000C26ED3E|nr:MarR family transcriptional regulator [Streptomyces sp. CB01201]PJN01453.1 MarR family transcriptional regulator [Streptomyces sp. CB01201]
MAQRLPRRLKTVTVGGAGSEADQQAAALAAREAIEVLEVLWGQSRELAPTAPVSISQLRVLYVLAGKDGINQRSLGEELGSTASSVSRMCDRLHALDFIERTPSSASRREVELRLSNKGVRYLKELRTRREESLAQVVASMTPPEQAAFAQGLACFRTALLRDQGVAGTVREEAAGSA